MLLGITIGTAQAEEARKVLPAGPGRPAQAAAVGNTAFFVNSLGSGVAADVYRVTCFGVSMNADVRHAGPFNDTSFQVAIVGSGGGIEGHTSTAINAPGKLSFDRAVVSRYPFVNTTLRAYLTYTEVNAPGSEKYDTIIDCKDANGFIVNPTVVKILDQ